MSGARMVIKPGQIKELHWNPNADEFHYYLKGKGQIALFGSGGRGKVADVKAGNSAYIPQGYGHAMLNTGDEDLEIDPDLECRQVRGDHPQALDGDGAEIPPVEQPRRRAGRDGRQARRSSLNYA